METKKLFILCGEAFAGKSTLSRKLAEYYGAKIVGRDAIYFATNDILALDSAPDEDSLPFWESLWPVMLFGVKNQLMEGNSVVIDDTCLFFKQREALRQIAKEMNAVPILVYLDIPRDVLENRKAENKISQNRHDVPSGELAEDALVFERPRDIENPVHFKQGMSFEELTNILDV